MRAFRAAEQLSAILATESMPPSARALAERVMERLSVPVRIAVVGAPGVGKRRIVEGLLGGAVLPAIAGLPPAEIVLGAGERIGVVLGDGAEAQVDVTEFPDLDPVELALVRLSAPLPLLEKIRFLVVPLEGGPGAARAALDWTFRRADMVLWCVPRLDGPERTLWPRLPEALRDHAYLAVTAPGAVRPTETDRMLAAEYFSETRDLSDGPDGPERIARLRTALLAHVSRARREDLEGALIFLDHHLSRQARDRPPPAPPARASAVLDAPSPPAPPPAARAPEPRDADTPEPATPEPATPQPAAPEPETPEPGTPAVVPPAAGVAAEPKATALPADASGTGRIVALLAARAERLDALWNGGGGAAEALDLCAEALEEAGEIARAEGGALSDLVDEAAELMLLLQLEGSDSALSDTLALLLQVRRECEAGLPA
jgi:pyruvate/2-oxoglutarate dehydrogenase complex dihydrolipoamide acyltransferase (E2) component